MNYIISENKLNSFIDDYFEKNDKLSNLRSVDTYNGLGTDYWQTHENYEEDEFISGWVFTYYPDLESYEYEDVYQEDEFPMIEMDNYIYYDLSSLFNEKIIQTNLLNWLNKTYGLEAVQIVPN
jgi:hypothetical protein